jgi:ABC-type uncharacterized transport system permease subunit
MKEADFASFYFVEYFDCIRCSLHDNTAPFFLKIISAFLGEFYPLVMVPKDVASIFMMYPFDYLSKTKGV